MKNVSRSHPHAGQKLHTAGQALTGASAAMLLIHGRGGTAPSILALADALARPQLAYVAPGAAGNSWYPHSFLSPLESNEPFLSSALQTVADALAQIESAGIPAQHVIIGGFSQGACLASEFVARNPQRYGGLLVFSGGLIGPPDTPREYPGTLDGTPVFLGCSDVDMHIPVERVHETTATLEQMGAAVTEKIYPGMAHTIVQDEVLHAQRIVDALLDE